MGPMIYCLEEADNGADLHLLSLNCAEPDFRVCPDAILGAPAIKAAGSRRKPQETLDTSLYHEYRAPETEACTLTFLPYYMWNNRGEGEMTVWVREG